MAIHGYTHDGKAMRALTSPDGDPAHPDSLDSLADRENVVVAYPNGTPVGVFPGRCWNAGGGENGFAAVASPAVEQKIDDIAYFNDLLDDIKGRLSVDTKRVYAVGISNGAAMAHRLAMELSDRLAAVATVAGCNQRAAARQQSPEKPMPLLHIHGTHDPIWPYQAPLELWTIQGGGHAWPRGQQFLPEEAIGKVSQEFSANEVIWDFFSGHTL